jgi:hypothetical protein
VVVEVITVIVILGFIGVATFFVTGSDISLKSIYVCEIFFFFPLIMRIQESVIMLFLSRDIVQIHCTQTRIRKLADCAKICIPRRAKIRGTWDVGRGISGRIPFHHSPLTSSKVVDKT